MQNVRLRLIELINSHVRLIAILIVLRWRDHQWVLIDLILRWEEIRLPHVVVGRVLEAEGVRRVGVLPLKLDVGVVLLLKLLLHHHSILRVFVMHMAVLFANWTDGTRLVLMACWLLGKHHGLVLSTFLHLLGMLLSSSPHVNILLRLAVARTVVSLTLHRSRPWPAPTCNWRSWRSLGKIPIIDLPLILLLDLRLGVIVHTHATLVSFHVEILVLLPIAAIIGLHHLVLNLVLLVLLLEVIVHLDVLMALTKVKWCVILRNGTRSRLAHTTIRGEELLLLHHWVVRLLALVKLLLRLTIGLVHGSELNICVVRVTPLIVVHRGARDELLLLLLWYWLLARYALGVRVELLGVLRMGTHVRNVTCVWVVVCWARLRRLHRLGWLGKLLMNWLLGHHLVLLSLLLHVLDVARVLLLVRGHCHRLWSRVVLRRNGIVWCHHLCARLISSANYAKLVPATRRWGHFTARLLLNHPYLHREARVRLESYESS